MRRLALLAPPLLLLAACTAEEPVEVTDEDVEAIEQSIVNISALRWELVQAESRVASMCMQDEGFTVHDPLALVGNVIPNRFSGFASPYSRIPTVEQAGKFAFGEWVRWTDTDAALEMREDADYIAATADEQGYDDPSWLTEHDEFKAMGEDYAAAWREAWLGAERYEWDAEFQHAMEESDGAAEFDTDQPAFGGCELKTIQVVYGEPELFEREDGSSFWRKPGDEESPLTQVGDGEIYEELSVAYADEEQAFLDCLADRGQGDWEFDEMGWLPTSQYLSANLYGDTTETYLDGELEEVAELPDGIDASDPVAAEFAIALDFAECAEESGLRDGSEELWARLYVEQLIGGETEIYAQEQRIKDQLANAQDYIEG
ncbi:hypothetical protein ACFQS3_15220 [Glycomyces mayteni]|uniref:Uncharacterized protein n=1 Tax=Glycomyces mayteni TaxID=543887 RepID=A0ABW2D8M7_9ACTN|nr:hypothetical protein GCM10025732_16110 [Glycomyces mayteni]